ncbi:MAG: hypothetical protein JWO79_1873 [Actinomycetia bacterium]|nr:hypothetical protein [Actinomycetes bacterium]
MITADPRALRLAARELAAGGGEVLGLAAAGQAVLLHPAVGFAALRSPASAGRAVAMAEPALAGLVVLAARFEALTAEVLAQVAALEAAEVVALALRVADTGAGVALELALRSADLPIAVERAQLDELLPQATGVVTEVRSPAGGPDPSIHGLFARLGTLPRGEVEIVPVLGADGVPRYVVLLRGIDPAPNPTLNSAAQAVQTSDRRSDAYSRSVAAALRLAGVPPGAELMLVGHSQGGIAAMNLAADPRWHVTHVLAAGSPISNKRVPPGTRVLRVENRGDPVPLLDGDRESGAYVFGPPPRLSHLLSSHDLRPGYLDELDTARFAADPLVRAFTSSAAPYLGAGYGAPRRFRLDAGKFGPPAVLVGLSGHAVGNDGGG